MKAFLNMIALAVLVVVPACEKTNTNFGNYKPLAALVSKADKVVVYEGLPHQTWEGDLREEELKNKKTVKLHEFPFYMEALKLKDGDAKLLTELFTAADSFEQYGGAKLCGGFHPDYCIEWHIGDDKVRCHVCFGCHEVKVYGPKSELYCDITNAGYLKFEAALKPYRQQRPVPKTPPSDRE
jgi:hypothetical protein